MFKVWCNAEMAKKMRAVEVQPGVRATDIATTLLKDGCCGLGKINRLATLDDFRTLAIAGA